MRFVRALRAEANDYGNEQLKGDVRARIILAAVSVAGATNGEFGWYFYVHRVIVSMRDALYDCVARYRSEAMFYGYVLLLNDLGRFVRQGD